MEQVTLPADLQALYAVLSNPVMAPIWLSMILEQTPFIQNPAVANWKKLGVTFLVALAWAIFAVVFNPSTPFTFSASAVYAIARSAFALCFGMNVWNKTVNLAIPWLRDFLLTLFNPSSVTVKVAQSSSDGATSQTQEVTKTTAAAPTIPAEAGAIPDSGVG